MRKLSTQCMDDLEKKVKSAPEAKSSPRKQTMDFLKQFARAYQAEPAVRPELCGVCVELRITERESILLGSLSFFVYFCKNKRQDYEAFDSAFPAFR